jgi:hypothetical protein
LVGFLARNGGILDEPCLRLGLAHGAAIASFAVENFSVDGLLDLSLEAIERRVRQIRDLSRFELELPERN